ncbi:hypothetical protein SAMN05444920_102897 [Nonomuraea solani]|uniref:Uncharacterized protein n=1 Tax=Nonomuraea solani TaxID=1144553 RepID=A0A1H5ZXA0_9ACTN|nr:hypothetical protein [Nonomuraea solani]SEG40405.1 hypothetical protein SAMN05444920_102897 [Nonomuraea solani]
MTAHDYGHRILPGTAAQTTPEVLDTARGQARTGLRWGIPVLAVQLCLTAWLLPQEGPAGFLGVLLAVVTVITFGVVAAWQRARRTESRILRSSPWEV